MMMEVLAYLCEQGGDPTILCKDERTPKTIAEEGNCQIAAALLGTIMHQGHYAVIYLLFYLEILELIHCKKSKRFPVPQYANIDTLHKTILHWLVIYHKLYKELFLLGFCFCYKAKINFTNISSTIQILWEALPTCENENL